jgi:hypothetical protein
MTSWRLAVESASAAITSLRAPAPTTPFFTADLILEDCQRQHGHAVLWSAAAVQAPLSFRRNLVEKIFRSRRDRSTLQFLQPLPGKFQIRSACWVLINAHLSVARLTG